MEYIDYSSFPMVASTDCSPTMEDFSYQSSFDKAFIANPFAASDASLTTFDTYLSRPVSSANATKSLDTTSSVALTTGTQLKPTSDSTFVQPSFAQLDIFSTCFPFDTNPATGATAFDVNPSPLSDDSQTPSLCGDASQDAFPLASPPLSPRPQLKRGSPESSFKFEDYSDPANPPKRKRGRPRLDRSASSLSSSSAKMQRNPRLPHNQVERKYREGLNASLERLRRTVPTFCQEDDLGGLLSQPKPSKAMILEGAIEYIKEIEKERDLYRGEMERLRRASRGWDPAGNTGLLGNP